MQEFVEKCGFSDIEFMNNNAYIYGNDVIVGTRGWSFTETENSEKMHNREAIRLENSIQYALSLIKSKNVESYRIICAMHYPPITKAMIENNKQSEYINIMKKYNIQTCIYGHLHGKSHTEAVEEIIDGVNLQLVSSDYLKFDPILI